MPESKVHWAATCPTPEKLEHLELMTGLVTQGHFGLSLDPALMHYCGGADFRAKTSLPERLLLTCFSKRSVSFFFGLHWPSYPRCLHSRRRQDKTTRRDASTTLQWADPAWNLGRSQQVCFPQSIANLHASRSRSMCFCWLPHRMHPLHAIFTFGLMLQSEYHSIPWWTFWADSRIFTPPPPNFPNSPQTPSRPHRPPSSWRPPPPEFSMKTDGKTSRTSSEYPIMVFFFQTTTNLNTYLIQKRNSRAR